MENNNISSSIDPCKMNRSWNITNRYFTFTTRFPSNTDGHLPNASSYPANNLRHSPNASSYPTNNLKHFQNTRWKSTNVLSFSTNNLKHSSNVYRKYFYYLWHPTDYGINSANNGLISAKTLINIVCKHALSSKTSLKN